MSASLSLGGFLGGFLLSGGSVFRSIASWLLPFTFGATGTRTIRPFASGTTSTLVHAFFTMGLELVFRELAVLVGVDLVEVLLHPARSFFLTEGAVTVLVHPLEHFFWIESATGATFGAGSTEARTSAFTVTALGARTLSIPHLPALGAFSVWPTTTGTTSSFGTFTRRRTEPTISARATTFRTVRSSVTRSRHAHHFPTVDEPVAIAIKVAKERGGP